MLACFQAKAEVWKVSITISVTTVLKLQISPLQI